MNIVIIDYGLGNVLSLVSALDYLGSHTIKISQNKHDILNANKIILPGVGAFQHAIHNIKKTFLNQYLAEAVIEKKIPILGICLGMQLMGISSTENGLYEGLNYINAHVTAINTHLVKTPHVGFNQVIINSKSVLYRDMHQNPDFYFTHSYKMESKDNINQSMCLYGTEWIASFEKDHVAGVQFHPELSQKNGLKLLKNFLELF